MTPPRRTDRARPIATVARAAPRDATPPASRGAGNLWLLAVPAALAALLFACRGAPLGTAVADDYSFLARLAFQRPLDLFDSMGATYYWRPLSRQVYFTLVGPWLLEAPWAAALLHGLILVAIGVLVFRIARRDCAASVSAAIAAGVMLSEPARVLLGWPSGAQHLLASAFALLAVHEAQARRPIAAALAALLALLSHESAALVLPLLPLIAWRESREVRATVRATFAAAGAAAVWGIGYAIARHHGVVMPPPHAPGVTTSPIERVPALLARIIPAALNVEDVHGPTRIAVLAGIALAVVVACIVLSRRAARPRLRAALPIVLSGLAWFVFGALPLAVLLPDWNEWRAWMPALGLAIAIPALLGAASPRLAVVWLGLRLLALLAAPATPAFATRESPSDGSHVSFHQLVRLQRVVAATRSALTSQVPALAPGSRVCFWQMPQLAEFAYQDSRALQVWYRDSTLRWGPFSGRSGLTTPYAAGIEFRFDGPPLAAVVKGESIRLYQRAASLRQTHEGAEADSLLYRTIASLGRDRGPFNGTLYENLALLAYQRQDYARADSLNEYALSVGANTGTYWLIRAARARMQGDRQGAETAIRASLEIEPNNPDAVRIARELDVIP